MGNTLTVLISTHNRVELLERALRYLHEARRPRDWRIEIFVVANACKDGTQDLLARYEREPALPGPGFSLPLRWISEPVPGKSHALNRAITLIGSEWVAFVDDDHRVDLNYFQSACRAAEMYPDVDILCGKILPDWDGSEPGWVHEKGPFRIYPLPVPHYDLGDIALDSPHEKATPGGGNWILRTRLLTTIGQFSTAYGPVGHRLGGAEDKEWIWRAIEQGARLKYVPDIVQYHYADLERLNFSYVLRKAFERSASAVRLSAQTSNRKEIPFFLLRKVGRYVFTALVCTSWQARRFYFVRIAAALGEIKGHLQARQWGDRRD